MLSRKSLAQDGWVIHEPHRGFRVAPLLRGDLLDTYRLWSIVEGEISARAAERITPQEAALVVEADTRLRDLDDHSGSHALDLNDVLHSPGASGQPCHQAPSIRGFGLALTRMSAHFLTSGDLLVAHVDRPGLWSEEE